MAKHPDLIDVVTAFVLIVVGLPLAASMLFVFLGAPMVMAGVELLMSRRG